MKKDIEFNSQIEVARWVESIELEPSVINSDTEELKSHLLDIIDDLKGIGLNDEEAFLIASKRLGDSSEWGDDYSEANNSFIQMRRSLIILSGVLGYYILYYFLRFSTMSYFLYSLAHKLNGYAVCEKINDILLIVQLILSLFFIYVFFFGKKIIAFIEGVRLKPIIAIVFLTIAIVLGGLNILLTRFIRFFEIQGRSHLFHDVYRYFEFSFPFIFCLGFVLLYYKYSKKVRI